MNTMNSYEALHRFYASFVTARGGVTDPRIVDAFATVKREHFVGAGPWHVHFEGGYMLTETRKFRGAFGAREGSFEFEVGLLCVRKCQPG